MAITNRTTSNYKTKIINILLFCQITYRLKIEPPTRKIGRKTH